MRLVGKVAIITGAAQGIGRAYAFGYAREGARVVVADIQQNKAAAVVEQICEAGGEGYAVGADITDRASVEQMVDSTVGRYGQVDVLVNNAALSAQVEQKPFQEISVDEWNRVIAVNLTGTFLCCQAVAAHMRRRKQGRIINISSAVTQRSGPWSYAHYISAKAGVVGLTRALASELGADNITVNAIAPGPVTTEASNSLDMTPEMRAIIDAQVIGRRETPDDLVGVAVFLASEDSRFITGQVINVDGGLNFR